MRRLALAIALAFVLSGVTRAGEIQTRGVVTAAGEIPSTGATALPPPTTVTTTGEIPTTGAPEPEDLSTLLTIILTLISIVR